MDDEFLLPSERLEVGDEMARGCFGAVSNAKLYGDGGRCVLPVP
jgi:hypothetical protein